MKKITAITLLLALLFSLASCTVKISNTDTGSKTDTQTNTGTSTDNTDTGSSNTDTKGGTNTDTGNNSSTSTNTDSGSIDDLIEATVVDFINSSTEYLTEATDGIVNITVGVGGTIELTFNIPSISPISYSNSIARKNSVISTSLLKASVALLADEKEEYKGDGDNGEGTTTVTKNYTTPEAIENYAVINSINSKIKSLIGETEYFTAADFPFMEELFADLIGTVKFKSVFVDLLESKDEYTTQDGEFLTKVKDIVVTQGDTDENKTDVLVGYHISGYKLENGILSTYSKATDLEGNLTQDTIYKIYELSGDNFYYEAYKLDDAGEKTVVDMLNIVKISTELEDVSEYYIQAIFGSETDGDSCLTANATVPFDEAYQLEEQWLQYVYSAYDDANAEAINKIPHQVYVEACFREEPNVTHYNVQYFRNFNRDTTGNEEVGEYPASWRDAFDIQNVFNLEKYISEEIKLQVKDYESFVVSTRGEYQTAEYSEYVPFALKEYSTNLIPNVTDYEKAYRIVVWGNDYSNITFESSNEDVVTVTDDGYLFTHNEGGAIVTVRRGRLVLYFEVMVMSTIDSDISEMMLVMGQEQFYGVNTTGVEVEYEMSNPEVATYDPDTMKITPVSIGKTVLKSTAVATGEEIELEITVLPAIEVTLSLNEYGVSSYVVMGVPITVTLNEAINANDVLGVHISSELLQDELPYSYDMDKISAALIDGEPNSYEFTFTEAGEYLIEARYTLDSQTQITMLQITVVVE